MRRLCDRTSPIRHDRTVTVLRWRAIELTVIRARSHHQRNHRSTRLVFAQPFVDHLIMEAQSSSSGSSSISQVYVETKDFNIDKVVVAEIETLSGRQPSEEIVLVDNVRSPGQESVSRAFPVAKKPEKYHFNPYEVNAAIVTCGGLCPGASV